MALPPQAIEKMVREGSRTQGAYRELLLWSSALFLLMLVVFFGLRYGYRTYLTSAGEGLDAEIDRWSQSISAEDQAATAALYAQLYNLKALLGSRAFASPAFDLLERTATPNVYYTKASLNTTTQELTLSGNARTLEDATAQAALFERQKGILRVNFTNAGQTAGSTGSPQAGGPWQFTIALFFDPAFFQSANSGTAANTPPPQAATSTNPAP